MKECELIKGGHTLTPLAVTITSNDVRKKLNFNNHCTDSHRVKLVPSAPPSNITIMASASTNQLPVQWKKIPETEANGIITGRYFV